MKKVLKFIGVFLLSQLIIFILFYDLEISPDKTRYALAHKKVNGFTVSIDRDSAFAGGGWYKDMWYSADSKYLLVEHKYKKENRYSVCELNKPQVLTINSMIESACLMEEAKDMNYKTGDKLELDFYSWHDEENIIRFDYSIAHQSGEISQGYFWFDYEKARVVFVDRDI